MKDIIFKLIGNKNNILGMKEEIIELKEDKEFNILTMGILLDHMMIGVSIK